MKTQMIAGGGGTRLHLVEAGDPAGIPILFLHGFSQSWLTWSRQLESDLTTRFRLFALDLRGHGLSAKPRGAYADSRVWADDVHAVITSAGLDHPVLCGWSYGPLVILDYLRHYGEGEIRGVNFVGGVTKLGSEEAASVLTAEFLQLLPGFFSTETEEAMNALDGLLRLCFARPLSTAERYLMLGYNLSVPAHVRQSLFSRVLDNDDLLPKLRKPVLISHGSEDAVVRRAVLDRQMCLIGHAQVEVVPGAGHACFWDEADTYNRSLQDFAQAA